MKKESAKKPNNIQKEAFWFKGVGKTLETDLLHRVKTPKLPSKENKEIKQLKKEILSLQLSLEEYLLFFSNSLIKLSMQIQKLSKTK